MKIEFVSTPGTLHVYFDSAKDFRALKWRLNLRSKNSNSVYFESSLDKTWISNYGSETVIITGDCILNAPVKT